jgi:hypothetical protein
MKILLACEQSQAVCKEFRVLGHEAYSCDILDCSGGHPEWHIKGDVLEVINSGCFPLGNDFIHDEVIIYNWDAMICFPECIYVCSSGLHWNKRVPGRAEKTAQAIEFAKKLWNAKIPKIGLENSIGCLSTHLGKPTQIIQPYNFGEDASKGTCLWLKGLPMLQPTSYFPPRIVNGKKRWGNQTDSGQNKLGPSPERSKIRSKTFPGIAKAMAEQWGKPHLQSQLNLF